MDKDFFKRIVEESHDEIFICDKYGNAIYCNKAFERNYGIKREDILGKSPMYLAEIGFTDKTPIPEVIKSKEKISIEQETIVGRKIVITATPVLDDKGEIEFIIENCRDITELNNIKNKLKDREKEVQRYKKEVQCLHRANEINEYNFILNGGLMKSVINTIDQVAKLNVNVLLLGESGTGKSTIAKYLHLQSERKDGPFITINCATISQSLLESELFGYEKGAFTGANNKGKIGIVELADGGTLFLDEIGEISPSIQAKFLQLIQEKTFTPIGGLKEKSVDIKIVSATNRNLYELVKEKKFREDLYYRLNVLEVKVPSLRERKEDLPEFISYFTKKYLNQFNMQKHISQEVVLALLEYDYPGNIRELQNIIQSMIIKSGVENISLESLPKSVLESYNINEKENSSDVEYDFDKMISDFEKKLIQKVYNECKSSYKLAKKLKISQSKANRLIRKYR
ncbi:MAG: sigma-54 interaction domain-containing protein [Peptostreptococcaceae bacterium]